MRKYGKWVLTLSLLAATPGLTLAAGQKAKDVNSSKGARAPREDNQRVAEEIANALRGKISGDNINIEFRDGIAVLSGSVSDPKMKKLATSLAEKVASVANVDNRMTVAEKKRVFTERLRGDSKDRSVVQAGHASESPKSRRVTQVNAEIPEIAGPNLPPSPSVATSANQETAEQIGAALSEAQLDGYDIRIRFQNGIAMLEGSVGTAAERASASRVASSVPGVRSVKNQLQCTDEAQAQQMRSPYVAPRGDIRSAAYMQQGAGQGNPGYQGGPPTGGVPMGPGAPPYPPAYGYQGGGPSQAVYNSPNLPDHAWPTYAQYPNSAAVSYPQQYSASAWPYIGPFYPYPQVPLGWRDATLRWDDGQWNLMFKPRTDRWWWFMNPNNW